LVTADAIEGLARRFSDAAQVAPAYIRRDIEDAADAFNKIAGEVSGARTPQQLIQVGRRFQAKFAEVRSQAVRQYVETYCGRSARGSEGGTP
jgi:hypothetical protein